jgi:exonuclease III
LPCCRDCGMPYGPPSSECSVQPHRSGADVCPSRGKWRRAASAPPSSKWSSRPPLSPDPRPHNLVLRPAPAKGMGGYFSFDGVGSAELHDDLCSRFSNLKVGKGRQRGNVRPHSRHPNGGETPIKLTGGRGATTSVNHSTSVITGLSWNTRRAPRSGLSPPKSRVTGKLEYLSGLVSKHSPDLVLLQEVGAAHATATPPDLVHSFHSSRMQLISCGAESSAHHSSVSGICTAVASSWAIIRVTRHPSGRGLALVIARGPVQLAAVNLYMPSGLDHLPLHSPEHVLARDLYAFTEKAIEGHDLCLVGGDLNETLTALDRRSQKGLHRPRRDPGPLLSFLRGSPRLADAFRHLHPETESFTRFQKPGGPNDQSASRIDYFFVPRSFHGGSWTMSNLDLPTHSDHRPIKVKFSCSVLPAAGRNDRRPWSPGFPRVAGASTRATAAVHHDCNLAASRLLARWSSVGPAVSQADLEQRTRSLLHAIRSEASRALSKGTRADGLPIRLGPLARPRAVIEVIFALRHSIREVEAGSRSPQSRPHRRSYGRLQELLGRPLGPRHDNIPALKASAEREMSSQQLILSRAWASASTMARRSKDDARACYVADTRTWMRRFVKEELAASSPIASAVDPLTGQRCFAAEVYMPIVRRIVSAPMSIAVRLKRAVATGPTPPSGSHDVRDTGCRPFWWDRMYKRGAKGIGDDVFANLTDPIAPPELRDALLSAKGGTSPGPDGCDSDLLRAITSSLTDDGTETPCLAAFTMILNDCLRLRVIPPVLKEGWITMVPKRQPDGSLSVDAENMRPISVLPELGKALSRVLASRISRILILRPELLSPAQRGFIANGCVEQCIGSLTDAIEDWRQRGRPGHLFVVSYDQAKAYDSIQLFTLRASLERFSMPEAFIQLVLSGLTGARSRVRTHDGLTAWFILRSSVRQGDPLAPLLYAIVTDALHEGLRDNPLFPATAKLGGYRFASATPPGVLQEDEARLCSVGFADDAGIVATSAARLEEMHEWVRSFHGAHCLRLNVAKTKLRCSHPHLAPTLRAVDGRSTVTPLPATAHFTYLGVKISLNLNWRPQQTSMARSVGMVCSRIRRYGFDLEMSASAILQFLLPRLRVGLLFAQVPDTTLRKWDTLIKKSVLQAAGVRQGPSLSPGILYMLSRVPQLLTHAWALRGEELLVTLNADYPSSASAWARIRHHCSRVAHAQANSRKDPPPSQCRAVATMQGIERLFCAKRWSSPQPHSAAYRRTRFEPAASSFLRQARLRGSWRTRKSRLTRLLGSRSASPGPGARISPPSSTTTSPHPTRPSPPRFEAFTDGSTGPIRGAPSGCSAVITGERGKVLLEHCFAVRASGNNYLSELVALLAAILAVPASSDISMDRRPFRSPGPCPRPASRPSRLVLCYTATGDPGRLPPCAEQHQVCDRGQSGPDDHLPCQGAHGCL